MIKRKPVGRTQSYGNKRETYIQKGLAILKPFGLFMFSLALPRRPELSGHE